MQTVTKREIKEALNEMLVILQEGKMTEDKKYILQTMLYARRQQSGFDR